MVDLYKVKKAVEVGCKVAKVATIVVAATQPASIGGYGIKTAIKYGLGGETVGKFVTDVIDIVKK